MKGEKSEEQCHQELRELILKHMNLKRELEETERKFDTAKLDARFGFGEKLSKLWSQIAIIDVQIDLLVEYMKHRGYSIPRKFFDDYPFLTQLIRE